MRRTTFAVSAVLPCFEEREHLADRVHALAADLEVLARPYEIVIVAAEAARDGTPEVAGFLAATLPAVRRILQPTTDPGYGRAVALGMLAACYPWVLLMDADGQFDLGDLPSFFDLASEVPVVIGFRSPRADPWFRRAAGALNTSVVGVLLGLGDVRDVDCAFKLIRRDLLGQRPLMSRTGAVNAEILVRARARGVSFAQIPVVHRPREGGRARFEVGWGVLAHLPRPQETLTMARDVAGLALRRLRGLFVKEEQE